MKFFPLRSEKNPYSGIKIDYIRPISGNDQQMVRALFDPGGFKAALESGGINLRGQRNLIFRLATPHMFNGTKYNFLKIKGHHYMPMDGGEIYFPSSEVYTDREGTPLYTTRIHRYPIDTRFKQFLFYIKRICDSINPNHLNFIEFEKEGGLISGVNLTKPPKRPQGPLTKREIETEISLEEKCLEENLLCPSPVARIRYPFKFKSQETYAYACLIPDDNEELGVYLGNYIERGDSNGLNDLISIQHKALRDLNERGIIHLFFHYGNSYFLGNTKRIVYHDFEGGLDVSMLDEDVRLQYPILDLVFLLSVSAEFMFLLRNKGKENILTSNIFELSLESYFGCDDHSLIEEVSNDLIKTNDIEEFRSHLSYTHLKNLLQIMRDVKKPIEK